MLRPFAAFALALSVGLTLSAQLRNLDGSLVTPQCADGKTSLVVSGIWTCVDPPAGSWGGITGTLSAQTDLQTALNGKQAAGTYATGTGTASGTNTGDQASVTGNAGTATALQNARAINGVNFDGTANVTIPAGLTATGTLGYTTGAGGTVTQLTSKATGVTLHKLCGTITLHNAALAAAATVSFIVTNSTMAATDVVHVQHDTVGAIGSYTVMPNTSANGSFRITLRNNSAGSLGEAIVLRFAIIKAVTS